MLENREARQVYRKVFLGKAGQLVLSELMEVCDFLGHAGWHEDPRMAERQAGQRDIINHILECLGITGDPVAMEYERIVASLLKSKPWEVSPEDKQQEAETNGLSG